MQKASKPTMKYNGKEIKKLLIYFKNEWVMKKIRGNDEVCQTYAKSH